MKTLRDKLKKTEEKLSESDNENFRLSIRAAAQFSELTPRPDFEPLRTLFTGNTNELNGKTSNEKTQHIYNKFKLLIMSKTKSLKKDSVMLSPKKNFIKRLTIFSNSNNSIPSPHGSQLNKTPSKKTIRNASIEENEDSGDSGDESKFNWPSNNQMDETTGGNNQNK